MQIAPGLWEDPRKGQWGVITNTQMPTSEISVLGPLSCALLCGLVGKAAPPPLGFSWLAGFPKACVRIVRSNFSTL